MSPGVERRRPKPPEPLSCNQLRVAEPCNFKDRTKITKYDLSRTMKAVTEKNKFTAQAHVEMVQERGHQGIANQ